MLPEQLLKLVPGAAEIRDAKRLTGGASRETWSFNAVDATYQSDLRELNEINFARFDAKLEQRAAGIEARIVGLEARMDQRFAEHRESLTDHLAAFESRITRWMFTMWTGTMLALAGVLIAVLRSR